MTRGHNNFFPGPVLFSEHNCIIVRKQQEHTVLKNTDTTEELLHRAQAIGADIREMESIDVDKAWVQTRAAIRRERCIRIASRITRYAAMLSIPLLISSIVLGFMQFGGKEADRYAEVKAATGTIVRYELPDHSTVWLNAGSSLRFPTEFRKDNRIVELRGEAYFDVQADKDRPFYVNTKDGMSIYVYGTAFNVSAYDDDTSIETMLERGQVNVITPEAKTIVLEPGDFLLYDKVSRTAVRKKADAYEKTAWKDGKLIFRNASIEEVMKRLERHFNVDICLDNKSGKEYRYRATFRNETLPQILDYLSRSADMKWSMEEAAVLSDDTGAAVEGGETLSKPRIKVSLY